ncbi:hypothetical protein D3C76_1457020 [compost metagenome]
MQVEAAVESDLTLLELAHLAFLHAITRPGQLVLGTHIDDELVGQAIDLDAGHAQGGVLSAGGQLSLVRTHLAGVGAINTDALHATHFHGEQGAFVVFLGFVLHTGPPRRAASLPKRPACGSVAFLHQMG